MKICAIPFDIVYGDVEANLLAMAHALHAVEPDTDVVVVPELFTTSFVQDRREQKLWAETDEGHTVDSLRRWAQFFGFAIAGSYLHTDGHDNYSNRGFFVEPSGEIAFYDKRHLFPLSTEDKVYTAGREMPLRVRFRGWEFMLVLCFDVRFPVWTRNRPGALYDVLLVPANWPRSRADQLRILLAARAVENQAYVVCANRSGSDNYGEYHPSETQIYDNLGNPIHETRSASGYRYALLSRADLDKGRERFPAWRASDSWTIDL